MKSIIDQNNLVEYIQIAELQGNNFETNRGKVVINTEKIIIDLSNAQAREEAKKHIFEIENNQNLKNMRIPRRPKWTTTMKAQQLERLENDAFLTWRRNLA